MRRLRRADGVRACRWPLLVWLHRPAALWGMWIEWSGGTWDLAADAARAAAAPRAAGESSWRCGFVEYLLTAAIYPDDLSREIQLALGARVLLIDAGVYAFVMRAGGAIVVAERS